MEKHSDFFVESVFIPRCYCYVVYLPSVNLSPIFINVALAQDRHFCLYYSAENRRYTAFTFTSKALLLHSGVLTTVCAVHPHRSPRLRLPTTPPHLSSVPIYLPLYTVSQKTKPPLLSIISSNIDGF